jgi:MFS family permease
MGSSAVAIVAIAVVADIVTRAERGKYMAYTSLGFTIGPVVGPVVGGVLTQFLGWRSVFVFLAILAGVMIILILGFLPETCRAIVGNGSVPPPQWNRSILQLLQPDSFNKEQQPQTVAISRRRPSFFDSIRIAGHKPTGLLILVITLISCGSMSIFASIPALFGGYYGLNALEIGLCYIPFGVGGLAARWTIGIMVDRNFQRHSRELGLDLPRNQQAPEHLQDMPLEKARLQLTLPLVYASSAIVILYGWLMQARVHVSGPLVVLFFLGIVVTGTRNTLFSLIVDLHAGRPATATAGVAFFRALSSAGVVAGIVPLLKAIGIGWTGVLIAAFWAVSSSALWGVYLYGHEWRRNARQHNDSG